MDSDSTPETRLESSFHTFTIPQVLSVVGDVVRLPRAAKRNRAALFQALEAFPSDIRQRIRELASERVGTKRKAGISEATASKRARVEPEADEPVDMDIDADETLLNGPFFEPPTQEVIEHGIMRMIDRTGNDAMAKKICMVCARLLFARLVEEMLPADLPNSRRLIPWMPHPHHRLTNGMLLHDTALAAGKTYVCLECKRKLLLDERPRLALANGMWLGGVPFQLHILTLPERLLVALFFPAAYIVKLWPKTDGARFWDRKTINNGMKGNVSTYKLNTAEIAGIAAGNTMPPSPRILASTIGVTFVGAGTKPLAVMPDFLRVRRQRVFEALLWLKAHNALYKEINISQEQLRMLPENAVPDEIRLNARYSDNIAGLQREQAGYVPDDAADEDAVLAQPALDAERALAGPEEEMEEYEPGVFPLQAHGVVDVQADTVPDNDLRAHAFANIARGSASRSDRDDFFIRKGSAYINEYPRLDKDGRRFDGGPGNPNHMLGAFPVLFPYGMGGFEVDRDVAVPYEAHVRWALEYEDRRFRKDLYFIFQVFGVIQKRQVCRSAGVQIKRSAFMSHRVSFLKLKADDFVKASAEETRKVPISNPVIRALRKQLTSIRARVSGTDESRISIRAQVWGMNLRFNPPSIWATLNLADTSDPVAQVLAGQEIDLDNFVATAGPDREARSVNIAGDPFAAAQFFHVSIRAILEELFGITANAKGETKRVPGIVGVVNGYIGTVEAQARGTLHLHILLWLKGAPTAQGMKAALQTEEFRRKVTAFLKEVIRADIPGTTGESVLHIPKESGIAYSRPEDPRLPEYEQRRKAAESRIARAVQVHVCKPTTCEKEKNGRKVCKRRAPWQIAVEDWILPSGDWGPRRLYGKMNAWNPPLLQVTRSNQDMKIVTNGQDTKDITFYITMYIAKKQNQASNASALLAKSSAFQKRRTVEDDKCKDINKRMIQQCANTLSRDQEVSGSEAVSYLMGWNDRFISHNFVPIYWDEVTAALKTVFPELDKTSSLKRTAVQLGRPEPPPAIPHDPIVRVRLVEGAFVLKDQLKEYTDRGDPLEHLSYYEYHVQTYDGDPKNRVSAAQGGPRGDENAAVDQGAVRRRPGRPASERVPYLAASKRKGCRIIRSTKIETIPHFIGHWFPRKDAGEYYAANMLALLKPWRTLRDLQAADGTFSTSFDTFMETATLAQKTIIHNINYFHECSDGARLRRDAPVEVMAGTMDLNDSVRREMEAEEQDESSFPLTEWDVARARNEAYAGREYDYGAGAMAVALGLGIFDGDTLEAGEGIECSQATYEDTLKYAAWGEKLKGMSKRCELVIGNAIPAPSGSETVVSGQAPQYEAAAIPVEIPDNVAVRNAVQQAALDLLNREQRRAHNIIESHLIRTLAGIPQEQLLMIVRGEGGTGKTVLLNAIAHTFAFHKAASMLAKTATTGVAASLVSGVTVHGWAVIPVASADNPNWAAKSGSMTVEKRKANILPVQYVNIDECSMITKQLLAQISQIVGQVKASDGQGDSSKAFGGVNVILFGDFHQFPPVGDPTAALYSHTNKKTQSEIGLAIYHQFTTVITLVEQKRIVDPVWKELLSRLRVGGCTEDDMRTLRTLLVTDANCDLPDWNSTPWDKAVLVTPRHGARVRWNTAALIKHCKATGNRMYIAQAEDTLGRNEGPLDMRQRVAVAAMHTKKTANLAERVELAVGMRAMVLINIATEADLANGTRGEVVDIKLDPREPRDYETDSETGATILQYPPVLILFRPDCSTFPAFEGLPRGTLPIVPSRAGFSIATGQGKMKITRRQLAMTAAYAFTDYKSQGQSLGCVCVDLQNPPSGKLTPFSAYVALSRSSGRDTIRLLRGFEPELFTTHPSEELDVEDRRLDQLTLHTKQMYP